jgi:hypothetical protein
MAADPLDALRLALMQDVLPVGLAVVERARKGGPQRVLAAFDGSSDDPLGQLREEGEPAASQLRDNLDRLQPGLGNPVMKVDVRDVPVEAVMVSVQEPAGGSGASMPADALDPGDLQATLARIAAHLTLLEGRLATEANQGATPGGS